MFKSSQMDYARQRVKGIFFCKSGADREECKKLVEDLGCTIMWANADRLAIQATRGRLQDLKARYLATEDDKAQISSRLKQYFDRIMIGR